MTNAPIHMRNVFRDRRNWPALLLCLTIIGISTALIAQQGNQVIPGNSTFGLPSPGPIGGTTPAAGTFTFLKAYNTNGVIVIDGTHYARTAAGINSAIADAATALGATGNTSGGTLNSTITAPATSAVAGIDLLWSILF